MGYSRNAFRYQCPLSPLVYPKEALLREVPEVPSDPMFPGGLAVSEP